MIDLSGKSKAMHAKLLQQIIEVKPSAKTNRPGDIATISMKQCSVVEDIKIGAINNGELEEESDTSHVKEVIYFLSSIIFKKEISLWIMFIENFIGTRNLTFLTTWKFNKKIIH